MVAGICTKFRGETVGWETDLVSFVKALIISSSLFV